MVTILGDMKNIKNKYSPPPQDLEQADIDSSAQVYPDWQLDPFPPHIPQISLVLPLPTFISQPTTCK